MSDFLNALGGGIPAAANGIVGGVLGTLQQYQTNKTNLRIARETNALNREMAEKANELNYKMFKEQQSYASPSEQRKMLEQAGYNPSDLVSSQYNPLSPSPNSATAGNPMIAAHLQAPTAFAEQLTKVAENFSLMASAKKANEEANNLKLQNQTYMEKFGQEMEALGLGNKWQELKNNFDSQNFGQQIEQAGKQLELSSIQIQKSQLEYSLYEKFGQKKAEKEIEHLSQQIELWKEQGKTEITKQDLNGALRDKAIADKVLAYTNARISEYLAPSQRAANLGAAAAGQATAQNQLSQAATNRYELAFSKAMQDYRVRNLVWDYYKNREAGKQSFQTTWKLFQEIKKYDKDLEYADFDKVKDNIITQFVAPSLVPPLQNNSWTPPDYQRYQYKP